MIGQVVYCETRSGRVAAVHCRGVQTPSPVSHAASWTLLVEVDGIFEQWRADCVTTRHPNPGTQSETPPAAIRTPLVADITRHGGIAPCGNFAVACESGCTNGCKHPRCPNV